MSGIVYKIVCLDTDECFVSSTTQSLNRKINDHKRLRGKSLSNQIVERMNFKSEIIEAVNFGDDIKVMEAKANEWIEKLNAINKAKEFIPYNKTEKGKKANQKAKNVYLSTENGKAKRKEQNQRYQKGIHSEEILQKKRDKYAENPELHALKKKEWREANPEKNKEQRAKWYKTKKEKRAKEKEDLEIDELLIISESNL
tara:strand:- start:167 stop:763 length:597 start_codon:yes stop_codon:yes gene_type:complete